MSGRPAVKAIPTGRPGVSTAVTSRDFDRDVGAGMRAAEQGPVMIIDHGRAAHVLLTVEEFERPPARRS